MQGGGPQVTRPFREVGGEWWRGFGRDQRQSYVGQIRGACEEYWPNRLDTG